MKMVFVLVLLCLVSGSSSLFTSEPKKNVCCAGIGCFMRKGSIPLPECPSELDMKIMLYTRSTPTNGQRISLSLVPGQYRSGKRLVFIVHGFWTDVEDGGASWSDKLVAALLAKGDYNVLEVMWDSVSLYSQAISNTRVVGAMVAALVKNLVANGRSRRGEAWCIGHSLGAHVCGRAGRKAALGRITALDPAKPYLAKDDPDTVVQMTDAHFVDAIHTGTKWFGLVPPVGHVDFYPNGGNTQPGCESNHWWIPDSFAQKFCSHTRAVLLFIESLTSSCQFNSLSSCTDSKNIPGSCTACASCQKMGFAADTMSDRGMFYLTTNPKNAFCQT